MLSVSYSTLLGLLSEVLLCLLTGRAMHDRMKKLIVRNTNKEKGKVQGNTSYKEKQIEWRFHL